MNISYLRVDVTRIVTVILFLRNSAHFDFTGNAYTTDRQVKILSIMF